MKTEFIDQILLSKHQDDSLSRARSFLLCRQSLRKDSSSEVVKWQETLRSTFNQDRFDGCSPEVVFGEIVLMEVNDFVSILYAALVRFYMPAVLFEDLETLTQDLIEIATSMTI
jgi:hypothetical protein